MLVVQPIPDPHRFPGADGEGVLTSASLLTWFSQVFANVSTGIVVADWNGDILQTNFTYRRLVEAGGSDLVGRSLADCVHPDDRAAQVLLIERLKAGRIPFFDAEVRFLRHNGSTVWANAFVSLLPVGDGAPQIVAIVNDITDRRHADARLRSTEARFRALYDGAPVGIVELGPDGRFVNVNESFCRIVSRSEDDLQDLTFAEITHPDDLAEDLKRLRQLNAGDIDRFTMEKRYLRHDGSTVWVNQSVSAVWGEDGIPTAYIAVIEDATDRKALETDEHRRRQRAELMADLVIGFEDDGHLSLQYLVDLLTARFCDFATVEAPDDHTDRIRAVSHRDPDLVATLYELRAHHSLDGRDARSVRRAALGAGQLVADVAAVRTAMAIPDDTLPLLDRLDPRSHVAVPLTLNGETHGVLLAGRGGPGAEPFTRDDLTFLQEVAARAGAALVSADVRRREQQVSLHFQQALLPGRLAHAPTLAVNGSYAPGTESLEVGGDWFDSIDLPDGRILLVVGDVVGHGLEAAAIMGRLRAGLAALATTESDPGRLLRALDHFASGPHGADFATVCCATVDPATGQLVYASAGHPPILVVDPDGSTRWLDQATGMPLCTGTVETRRHATTILVPGSTLVLYSDGLVERRRQTLFDGLNRLADVATRLRDAPMASLADRIITEMTGDHGAVGGAGGVANDDIVVLAVRYEAATATPFQLDLDADPRQLASVRASMRTWLRGNGVDASTLDRALLLVGEACANSIDHAYLDREGGEQPIHVELWFDTTGLHLEVRDRGHWRPPGPHGADRGRGTMVMEAMAGSFERTSGPGGTVVRMHLPLRSRADRLRGRAPRRSVEART
jgi:PAS domain S-box-containing protein